MFSARLMMCALLALLPLNASAQGMGFDALMSDTAAPASKITVDTSASVMTYKKGESFYIGYTLNCQAPWHAYFRNPATVGLPMSVSMQSPEGFEVEGPYWSFPKRDVNAVGTSYSYSHAEFVWLVTPEEGAPTEATFTINSTAQLCSETGCEPPTDSSASLSLNQGDATANPDWKGAEARVEVLGDSSMQFDVAKNEKSITLKFQTPSDVSEAYFFSEDNSIDPLAEQVLTKDGDVYSLELPLNEGKDSMYPAPEGVVLTRLQGLLKAGDMTASIDLPLLPAVQPMVVVAQAGMPADFLSIIGFLFIGGLILNLMPCVFPVLGLKIMSFVELSGGSRMKIFLHSATFVFGVLISFWLLSVGLIVASSFDVFANQPWTEWWNTLANDAGSSERSWATWMQSAWVNYVLVLILLVLGLSMYGMFEIGVGATGAGQGLQQKKGLSGSFFSGLFTTLVATPCAAPFLGPSIALAMGLPALWLILAMSFMALGLAFPYIVIGIFPVLIRFLPRPGAWMESLKQGLSFLMLAAAAWFSYVYFAFVPEEMDAEIPWMMVGFIIISSACWVYGRWCPIYRTKVTRAIGALVALGLLALGVAMSKPLTPNSVDMAIEQEIEAVEPAYGKWFDWSPELMQATLDEGTPVFVDFTAKWCMTCQFNKKNAYTQQVYEQFYKDGVVLMRADKTAPNPAIDAELRKIGRSSVPVNVLYQDGEEPAITTELFTASYLLDFLKENLTSR
ncbi:MAG: thioredoxin family protein [Akkermansia sp.]